MRELVPSTEQMCPQDASTVAWLEGPGDDALGGTWNTSACQQEEWGSCHSPVSQTAPWGSHRREQEADEDVGRPAQRSPHSEVKNRRGEPSRERGGGWAPGLRLFRAARALPLGFFGLQGERQSGGQKQGGWVW